MSDLVVVDPGQGKSDADDPDDREGLEGTAHLRLPRNVERMTNGQVPINVNGLPIL